MAAITAQLELIRGEKAPATPYDPRQVRIEQRRRTRGKEEVRVQEEQGTAVQEKTAQGNTAPDKAVREMTEVEHEKGHGK